MGLKNDYTYSNPNKQFAIKRLLVDKKDWSNRYNFESLVDIYFHTCRHCKDFIEN
jgi:hypothetical protein